VAHLHGSPTDAYKGMQRHANACKGVQRRAKACKGVQRRAKACKGVQRRAKACKGVQRPKRTTKRVRRGLENSSETQIRIANFRKTLPLGHIYPSPMLVRVRESAIADYAPPQGSSGPHRFPLHVHNQASTCECARALTREAGEW
jgi:hypothetical protein